MAQTHLLLLFLENHDSKFNCTGLKFNSSWIRSYRVYDICEQRPKIGQLETASETATPSVSAGEPHTAAAYIGGWPDSDANCGTVAV